LFLKEIRGDAIVQATKINVGLFNNTFVLGRLIVIKGRNANTIQILRKIKGRIW